MFITREAKDREEQVKLSTLQRVTNTHLKTHIHLRISTIDSKSKNEATLCPVCNNSSNKYQNDLV